MESAETHPKVLILGADPLVRADVRVLLGRMGYRCLIASSLQESVELAEHEKPDAVVLDPQLGDFPPAQVVAEPSVERRTNRQLEIRARENFWVSAGLPDLNTLCAGRKNR